MKWWIWLCLLCLPVVVFAQTLPPDSGEAYLNALVEAIARGDWRYVAVVGVIALTYVVRKFGPSLPGVGPYLVSSRAGAITALVLALATGLAPPILGWVPWSPRIVLDVLLAGFGAIGGWVGVRRIVGSAPPTPTLVPVEPAPGG